MNTLIMNTLKPLGITTRYMNYDGKDGEYIIFTITSEEDSFFTDDVNESEINTISLNFWYTNGSSYAKIKEIKRAMKENGFIYIGGTDLFDNGYFGRNMMFKYLELDV